VTVRSVIVALALCCAACGSSNPPNYNEVVNTTLNDAPDSTNLTAADVNAEAMPADDMNAYAAGDTAADSNLPETDGNYYVSSNLTNDSDAAANDLSEE